MSFGPGNDGVENQPQQYIPLKYFMIDSAFFVSLDVHTISVWADGYQFLLVEFPFHWANVFFLRFGVDH